MKNNKFIYCFIFFLFLFTLNKANSKPRMKTHQTEEIIEKIDQLNQPNYGFPTKDCQHCLKFSESKTVLTSEEENDIFQKCAVDLCGPANKRQGLMNSEYTQFLSDSNNINKRVTVNPEISNKFNKKARSIITKAIKNIKEILKVIENKSQNLNPQQSQDWNKIAKRITPYYTKPSKGITVYHPKTPKENLLSFDQFLKQFIQQADNNTNEQHYLKYCESLYAVIITQDQQIKKFKEDIKLYKDKFLNTIFADYSKTSQQQFANHINNTLIIDTPEENGEKQFIDNINNIVTATKKNSSGKFNFSAIMKVLSESSSICPDHISSERIGGSAFYISESNKILTGFLVSAFPEYGKQILVHELAHVLSEQFTKGKLSQSSYKRYKQLRSCAKKRFTFDDSDIEARKNNIYHENDNLTTEENIADLISHLVFQNEPTIALCLQTGPSERDSTKYANLKIIGSARDQYSPPFLRIIMEAIHKRKKLSPACQQVVDMYKDRVNFKPCF